MHFILFRKLFFATLGRGILVHEKHQGLTLGIASHTGTKKILSGNYGMLFLNFLFLKIVTNGGQFPKTCQSLLQIELPYL